MEWFFAFQTYATCYALRNPNFKSMDTQIRSIIGRAVRISFIFVCSLALPAMAHASVSINEVMYNPQGTDSGREWIEIYNDGAVDVTIVGGSGKGSWRVVDSANHTIVDPAGGVGRGSLVVPAGGYLVVSTDPSTFVGEYSGSYSVVKSSLSLNNTGTTVSLVDGTGATVSSVTYASSQGGNDNGTSLQIASGSWIQALPTPGAANATEAYEPPQEETSPNSTPSKSNSTSNPGYVAAPLPQVFANAGGDRRVIVGADTKFVATAYDRDKDVISYAKFFWNFGDGTTAEGPWVMHHYSYPGRYAVELTITNTSLRNSNRITVTAEPASVSVEPLALGGVSVKNNAGHDLDLSYWIVKEGEHTFALPEHSVVLEGSSINISTKTLGFEAYDPKLLYPDGSEVRGSDVADTHVDIKEAQGKEEVSYAPLITIPAVETPQPVASSSEPTSTPELAAAVIGSGAAMPWWPLAGLGSLIGVGIASVVAVRRKPGTQGVPGEFTIE